MLSFLEFGKLLRKCSIRLKIPTLLKKLELCNPQTIESVPMNTFINSIINMDSKEVSNLYTFLDSGKDSILINIMNTWKEKTAQMFACGEVEKAFYYQFNVNMYMHLIQFRFLHYGAATKSELCKMKTTQT